MNPARCGSSSTSVERVAFLPAQDGASGSVESAGEAVRVLIVEDDYLIAMQAEAALAEAGFEVVGVAASAEEAIELAASHRPSLLVVDVRLDGRRDGIDLALELFRRCGIRSVFATAHFDSHARRRAEPAEPLGWLQKPYTMASLVELVRAAAERLR
ncbi:MAG TPA: response regulator [Dongiaceae bacterium]|nr:response regulator [Dongiaceae bacterium]